MRKFFGSVMVFVVVWLLCAVFLIPVILGGMFRSVRNVVDIGVTYSWYWR